MIFMIMNNEEPQGFKNNGMPEEVRNLFNYNFKSFCFNVKEYLIKSYSIIINFLGRQRRTEREASPPSSDIIVIDDDDDDNNDDNDDNNNNNNNTTTNTTNTTNTTTINNII